MHIHRVHLVLVAVLDYKALPVLQDQGVQLDLRERRVKLDLKEMMELQEQMELVVQRYFR